MDSLEVEIARTGNEVWVKFQNFRTGTASKEVPAHERDSGNGSKNGRALARRATKCSEQTMPGRACGCKVWPAAILFAFCVQAITGFFLWVFYSPSEQTAWESVWFIQNKWPAAGCCARCTTTRPTCSWRC